jgi:hypothetical protein
MSRTWIVWFWIGLAIALAAATLSSPPVARLFG